MSDNTIYLDHAATAPPLPEVLEEMMPYLRGEYGNPSSVYALGRRARHVVEKCRQKVGAVLGVQPAEILFTSGGSEANNTVLAQARGPIVSSLVEHDAIRVPLDEKHDALLIQPDAFGRVTRKILNQALENSGTDPVLASFMTVNNELGTLNPISELSSELKLRNILFHTDAVQAAGSMDLGELASHVDYLTLSGHKIGGPKGIGALFVRAGVPFKPLIRGGPQEQDRRAGTENVAAIAGFAKSLELTAASISENRQHLSGLRSYLVDFLSSSFGERVRFNTPLEEGAASPHILNVLFLDQYGKGLDGEMLILGLDMAGVFVSAGSACSSGTIKTSRVLRAIGISESKLPGAIRFSMGPSTTLTQMSVAASRILEVVERMS